MTSPYWDGAPASPELHQISFKGACVIGRHRMCEAVTVDKPGQPRGGHRGRIRDSCRFDRIGHACTSTTHGHAVLPRASLASQESLLAPRQSQSWLYRWTVGCSAAQAVRLFL